jgi:cob(I)alamin adenosyltransferase
MKVYTKTGDRGKTSLVGGKRVSKGDLRLDAYGTADELISHIGLLRDEDMVKSYKQQLITIQNQLMVCSSHLASDNSDIIQQLPIVDNEDIIALEKEIDHLDKSLPPLNSFILPGGHSTVSICHIARTVCRRAERLIVQLDSEFAVNEIIIKYFNRLSDYLFVLARKLSSDLNAEEIAWKP